MEALDPPQLSLFGENQPQGGPGGTRPPGGPLEADPPPRAKRARINPEEDTLQARFWDRCDEREAQEHLRELALDVWEWTHQLGHGPVERDRWALEFRDTEDAGLNERQWLKLRERFEKHGVPFELSRADVEGQREGAQVLLALPRAAREWAQRILDQGQPIEDEDEDEWLSEIEAADSDHESRESGEVDVRPAAVPQGDNHHRHARNRAERRAQ